MKFISLFIIAILAQCCFAGKGDFLSIVGSVSKIGVLLKCPYYCSQRSGSPGCQLYNQRDCVSFLVGLPGITIKCYNGGNRSPVKLKIWCSNGQGPGATTIFCHKGKTATYRSEVFDGFCSVYNAGGRSGDWVGVWDI